MNAPQTLAVRPLSPALGAEVTGIDLSRPLEEHIVDWLRKAWDENLVLLFRKQSLSEDEQLAFARYFGDVQSRPRPKETRPELGYTKNPEVMLVSNVRIDGKLIGSLPDGEMHFHSDMCYIPEPPRGTMLYGMEIPRVGGDTLFVNMYKAYDTLPSEIKTRIEGKTVLNVFLHGSTVREGNKPDLSIHPNARHPVIRLHPQTRRPALFVNRLMSANIDGLTHEESDAVLSELFKHIEQPEFIYAHKWQVGDLIMWDNNCTLHARTDFDDKERRMLRRIVIK